MKQASDSGATATIIVTIVVGGVVIVVGMGIAGFLWYKYLKVRDQCM